MYCYNHSKSIPNFHDQVTMYEKEPVNREQRKLVYQEVWKKLFPIWLHMPSGRERLIVQGLIDIIDGGLK